MQNFNESEIKYLAGLFDTDGCVTASFRKSRKDDTYYMYLTLQITAAESVDRDGAYVKSLGEKCGSLYHRPSGDGVKSCQNVWKVSKHSDLNKLVPRLLKHLVVKGKHLERLYGELVKHRGQGLTSEKVSELKSYFAWSRQDTGPVKPKNHPTWSWVAGVVDGDGYLCMRQGRASKRLSVAVNMMDCDTPALELLQKAFGGKIHKIANSEVTRWERNLGVKDKTFALHFLRKLHTHSNLKKWKIEQMIYYLQTYRRD